MTVFASALDSNSTVTNPQDKLTDELKEVMSNAADDEYIPIYIFLNELGDEAVYAVLSTELGETITAETEARYIQSQITSKIEKIRKSEELEKDQGLAKTASALTNKQAAQKLILEANISTVMSESEIETCLESGMPIEEIIEISEQTQFLSLWREKREYLNGAINSRFEEKLNTKKCRNIYIDQMISYVEMECEKSYIYALARLSEVKEIGYYTEPEYILDTLDEEPEDPTYTTGYHMTEKEGISYDAAGVKIGVIELPKEIGEDYGVPSLEVYYDDSNVHLSGKTESQLIANYDLVTGGILVDSPHATTVLSIICGNEATRADGVKYKGIAPNATVYYTSYNCANGFKRAIAWCLENDVSVINMSFGLDSNVGYSTNDQYVDCIIEQYRVSIVKSAGNYKDEDNQDSSVTSPGLAYNAITVGNMNWETNADGQLQLHSTSCYQENSYLCNKPDISAYGTDICMLDAYGNVDNRGTGTSFAAPMVTGTIALMMKENSNLIGKPDAIKSILLTTAQTDNISSEIPNEETPSTLSESNQNAHLQIVTGHPDYLTVTPVLRKASGAGLLNIEGAIATSKTNLLQRYGFRSGDSVIAGEYYFEENQKIKVSLVFEKFDYGSISLDDNRKTDWDLEILDSTGSVIASSWAPFNNVEILECEFKQAGYYSIKIANYAFPSNDELNESNIFYDKYGNQTTLNSNKICYASVLLACGCDTPELSGRCNGGETYEISCSNCLFTFQEKHSVTTHTVEYDDAIVEYSVQYIFRTSLEWQGFFDRMCSHIQEPKVFTKNSAHRGVAIVEDSALSYQPDGTTLEIMTIQILIVDSELEIVTSWNATFRVTYDLSTGLYYINGG